MKTVITNSADETQELAEELAENVTGPAIFALSGELGAGKTTFVQGFAKGLKIKHKIISPTFLIIRKYDINPKITSKSLKSFYHIDLYRLESERGIEGTGILEILEDNSSIVVIEWPEKLGKLLPKERIDIHFEYIDDEKRKIAISNR